MFKHNLKLISLHIPKTAGTSFRNILKSVYGSKHVVRFDIKDSGHMLMDEKLVRSQTLPKSVHVIHGHFRYRRLVEAFDVSELPLITWIRNPIERVVSNYYYLASVLAKRVDEDGKDLNIVNRMMKTLMEFACEERNQNRISKFLDGASLDDFHFIGVQDFFNEELKELSRLMNWPEAKPVTDNRTEGKRLCEDPEILEEIGRLNADDMDLYSEVMNRKNREVL